MKSFIIDCGGVTSAPDFWERYVGEVKPEGANYFGRSLDAFNDALAGGPGDPGKCELVLLNSKALEALGPGFLQHLEEIVAQSRSWSDAVIVFR